MAGLEERLADRRYLTLIVRINLTAVGGLAHGQVIDAEGQAVVTFRTWDEFHAGIAAWLERQGVAECRGQNR